MTMKIGNALRRWRNKMPRPRAAEALGITSQYLGMIEQGKRTPSVELLHAMEKLYKVKIFTWS